MQKSSTVNRCEASGRIANKIYDKANRILNLRATARYTFADNNLFTAFRLSHAAFFIKS